MYGLGTLLLIPAFAACSSGSAGTAASSASSGTSSSSTGTTSSPTGTTISIGVIGTFSTAYASSVGQPATVAPAWADYVNAHGGIDGHKVKVILEDDQNSPAQGQAVAQDLISQNVAAIVQGGDQVVNAYDSAVIAKGIPLISGQNFNPDWFTKAGMFPSEVASQNIDKAYVGVAVQYGHAKKIGYAYCAEVAVCAEGAPPVQAAAKAAGIGYAGLAVSATAPSYAAQCLELQQENVDYVELSLTASVGIRFIQSCQAQGYNPTWGTNDSGYGDVFLSLKNFTAYGPAFSFPLADTSPGVAQYTQAMTTYAQNSNWKGGAAGDTWTGLEVLQKAIQDANVPAASPVTAQNVLTGLYSFKGETLGGLLANPLTFTKGQPANASKYTCYFVMGVSNGKLTAPGGLKTSCAS
jgi:branched-chain amino acid transport system substrate-binding protein